MKAFPRLPRLASLCASAAVLGLAGCATAPFPKPAPFSADVRADIPAAFAARCAPSFEQVNALTFRYLFRELTALGVLSIDRPDRAFTVSCMTPLGVKLFDAVCRDGAVESRFVHPEIAKRGGDLAKTVGESLTAAYFDLTPPAGAAGRVKDGRLVFTSEAPGGISTEYRYAGADGHLAEKIRRENGRLVWTVDYRRYSESADGLVPAALVFRHHRYGYRLIVSTKET
jgi:hypothetical protein